MKVLVAGSTGFVGRQLCPALQAAGHEVLAMTRRPEHYSGAGEPVKGDVAEPASLVEALHGCDAAYYLVHRLGEKNSLAPTPKQPLHSARRPPRHGSAGSSIWEGWETRTTTSRSICAVVVRSRACSARAAFR